jgi:WD40 repeat protein
VTDLCVIENSHSVASASVDGQVHVWRVELACSASKRRTKDSKEVGAGTAGIHPSSVPTVGQPLTQGSGLSVRALSVVRTLDLEDGCVTALQHFTADMASILTFTTQKGAVVGWDLRAAGETFRYSVRPEFGVPTCLVVPPSSYTKSWIIVGTSTGYVLMWDTRYDVMTAAWRHSSNGPIHQMSYLQSHSALEGRGGSAWSPIPSSGLEGDDDDVYDTLDIDGGDNLGPRESFPRRDESHGRDAAGRGGEFLIIAAGCNEVSVWTLPILKGGESMRCFRAVPVALSRDSGRGIDVPRLIAVTLPSHPHAPVRQAINNLLASPPSSSSCDPSIGAVLAGHREGSSPYLVSGGSDGQLRHWDWASPSRCCVLAGLSPAQHRPAIVSVHGPHSPRAFDPMLGDEEAFEEYVDRDRDRESQRDKMDRRRKNPHTSGSSAEHSMFVCYDTGPPSSHRDTASMLQAQLPLRDSKGTTHSPAISEVSILPLFPPLFISYHLPSTLPLLPLPLFHFFLPSFRPSSFPYTLDCLHID